MIGAESNIRREAIIMEENRKTIEEMTTDEQPAREFNTLIPIKANRGFIFSSIS